MIKAKMRLDELKDKKTKTAMSRNWSAWSKKEALVKSSVKLSEKLQIASSM